MIEKTVIEWKFEPGDYFEDNFNILSHGCSIEIESGNAKAIIDPHSVENIPEKIEKLHQDLVSRFLAVQAMTHQKYNLSEPSRYDLNKDGTKNFHLHVKDIVCVVDISPVDLIIKDKDGNVISDTKKDRVDKKKWFSETSAKFREKDETLNQMLKSYSASVTDPGNELVHLYEIRDAASKKFGGETDARSKLNVTKKDWSDFGLLANKKPLLQGRHRGSNVGKLRKAEISELATARKIASKIVENYLVYLENNK